MCDGLRSSRCSVADITVCLFCVVLVSEGFFSFHLFIYSDYILVRFHAAQMLETSRPLCLGQNLLLASIMKRNKWRMENTNPTRVAMETRPPQSLDATRGSES